jgi:type VI secretion system protein
MMTSFLPSVFKSRLRRGLSCLVAAWALVAVSGCAMVGGVANVVASSTANLFSGTPGPSFLDWKAITLVAAPYANQNSPLAVDLVFVRDAATLEKLLTLPAAKWFASKEELLKTYPNTMTIKSWELVPQQVLQLSEEALGSPRVAGMVLFADYLSPGDHRAQLPLARDAFLVELGVRSFSVQTRPR